MAWAPNHLENSLHKVNSCTMTLRHQIPIRDQVISLFHPKICDVLPGVAVTCLREKWGHLSGRIGNSQNIPREHLEGIDSYRFHIPTAHSINCCATVCSFNDTQSAPVAGLAGAGRDLRAPVMMYARFTFKSQTHTPLAQKS